MLSISSDPKCILVVDDDDAIREAVSDILLSEGYRVETANNGEQALDKVGTARPDAILLDLIMPLMDGWTFLREWQSDLLCGGPVVVMSAQPLRTPFSAQDNIQAILSKLFDVDALLDTVERLLKVPTEPPVVGCVT